MSVAQSEISELDIIRELRPTPLHYQTYQAGRALLECVYHAAHQGQDGMLASLHASADETAEHAPDDSVLHRTMLTVASAALHAREQLTV